MIMKIYEIKNFQGTSRGLFAGKCFALNVYITKEERPKTVVSVFP